MDAAASALFKGCEEQRGAGRRLQCEGLADIVAVFGGVLLGGPLNHEDVVGFDEFLLDAGGCKEDMVAVANGRLVPVSASLRFLARRDLPLHRCR